MNTQQKMYYTAVLDDVKEKRALVDKMKNDLDVDIEEIKESADDLTLQLKKMGISNTSDLKNYIQKNNKVVKNIAKNVTPKNINVEPKQTGIFRQLIDTVTNMTLMTGISSGIKFITQSTFFKQLLITAWNVLKVSAVVAGLAAVTYFFAKVFVKIYRKIVDKAIETKNKKQELQLTNEELSKIFDISQVIQETTTQDFYTEAMNPEKQTMLLDVLIRTAQDALDILSIFAISSFVWVSLVSALTPIMMAALVGSALWVILYFTRNILKRTYALKTKNQTKIKQVPTNMVPNPA